MMANKSTPTATISIPSKSGTASVAKIPCSGGRYVMANCAAVTKMTVPHTTHVARNAFQVSEVAYMFLMKKR